MPAMDTLITSPSIEALPTLWPKPGELEPVRQPTLEMERLYRKQRLAASFRLFANFGFDMGGAGHITARDPEYLDHFWVNPFGKHFSQICVSDLLLVSHDGTVVEGEGRLNQAAFAIHSQIHQERPDVIGAAHSHSLYGKVWASLGRKLDPISQDAASFYEDHALFDDFSGVVNALDEGKRIARSLGMNKAAILQNHGILTVGGTVEAAVWWYLALENACKTQILAQSAGTPVPMSHEVAKLTHDQVGIELAGIFQFQPYWDQVLAGQPDFLN
ncbi:MAG: class II aldolase/adducin family protein [Sphingobium sp.]